MNTTACVVVTVVESGGSVLETTGPMDGSVVCAVDDDGNVREYLDTLRTSHLSSASLYHRKQTCVISTLITHTPLHMYSYLKPVDETVDVMQQCG